jgi:hypothetical protein
MYIQLFEAVANVNALINFSSEQIAALKLEKSANADCLYALASFTLPFHVSVLANLGKLTTSSKLQTRPDYIWLSHCNHAFA